MRQHLPAQNSKPSSISVESSEGTIRDKVNIASDNARAMGYLGNIKCHLYNLFLYIDFPPPLILTVVVDNRGLVSDSFSRRHNVVT